MRICRAVKSLIFLLCIAFVGSTLSKSDKSKTKTKTNKYKLKSGPQPENVITRQLVSKEPTAKEIIVEQNTYFVNSTEKLFNGPVLGYVTPWNSHGYDVAKLFASKFTQISPVWLQIRRKASLKYEVTGKHDIDSSWMTNLRKNHKEIKIVPRILFEGWTVNDYSNLFIDEEEQKALATVVVETCKQYKFNGIVLELWSQIGGSLRSDVLVGFIKIVSGKLKLNNLELLLVIPPIRGVKKELFTAEHFNDLAEFVSFFSLMTYDFSNPQRPGPNSPIKWVQSCVEALVPIPRDPRRSKILLGLNFYGNDYTASGGGPIVNHDFLRLLKDYKGKLKVDEESEENFFEVRTNTGKHFVFYPTLYSISKRIKLAEELGTGLSIWELGQGLEYFYDLL